MIDYVLYHDNCIDGFGAAFAAWLWLGESAVYIPVRHYEPLPQLPQAGKVYILDFCYREPVLNELESLCENFIVLDHHVGNMECLSTDYLNSHENVIFDTGRSGATLTWIYFHGYDVPIFFKYIEDYDLWRLKMPHVDEFNIALSQLDRTFEAWESVYYGDPEGVTSLITTGRAIIKYRDGLVCDIVRSMFVQTLDGVSFPAVYAPSHLANEVCTKLIKDTGMPMAGVCYGKDYNSWSIRGDGRFDCAEFARRFGGNGHTNSAGFKITD